MRHSKWLSLPFLFLAAAAGLTAQQPKTYRARLSPVPIDIAMQANVAGTGSMTASLTGSKLTLNGTFEGLRGPATIAQLHKSPTRGMRGPVVAELMVARGTEPTGGTITGTLDLTPLQVTDLEKGRFYVQLHSEKAPDGNLWGWLLPQEKAR
jgi:CHRD domain-containing protein